MISPKKWKLDKKVILCISIFCFSFFAWSIVPLLRPLPPQQSSTKILARDGSILYELKSDRGTPVLLAHVPRSLIFAVLASEDQRFWNHQGVDWFALTRATRDWMLWRPSGGASTIEMQLVKKIYFSSAPRSVVEKAREIIAAHAWAAMHSKEETLERYLNTVAFGHRASGIASAAQRFFHKEAADLSLAESALLAGILPSPSQFDPTTHRFAAQERKNLVLDRLRARDVISMQEAEDARASDVVVFPARVEMKAPHFVLRVIDELEERAPPVVYTPLDPELQRVAEDVVSHRLARLHEKNVTNAAVIALHPKSGDILAYVGSADYFDDAIAGQIDMTSAKRQPGSALKPFLYFEAFRHGKTPATVIADLPVRFETERGESYYPKNYSGNYFGPVTLRDALGSSLNIPAVKLLSEIGLPSFFDTLASFGLRFSEPPEHYGLGVVLGGGETTLIDLVRAYAKLAQMDTPAAAFVHDILADARARARAFGETSLMEVGARVAVKTGTTKDFRDNWAIGYTPDFVLGVWVGNANNTPMRGVSGISGAVPIWHDIMEYHIQSSKQINWPRVSGIVEREICLPSGLLATEYCPKKRIEKFIIGTEPTSIDDWYVSCRGKVYLHPPSDYAAWSIAAKHEELPASCATTSARMPAKILAPLHGDTFVYDELIAAEMQRISFITSAAQRPVVWRLNGEKIVAQDSVYLWEPRRGTHALSLDGVAGQIQFRVR